MVKLTICFTFNEGYDERTRDAILHYAGLSATPQIRGVFQGE